LAGRINEDRGAAERSMALGPGPWLDRTAEIAGKFLCAYKRAVAQSDLARPALKQTVDDRSRATAATDNHRRAGVGAPIRKFLCGAFDETEPIVVGAKE